MAAEKELLEGISLMKQGKEEGFNILYSYTYNFVYARARSATKNETDAQDLTQETFIQAYKGIASLEDANNVYAWLGGIVFRQGAKLYNKTKKELLLNEDQDYIFDEVETKDVDALPEESAELKATSDVVMSMIDELPELQRSAIVSFYYDHMKIEEIANIFECSVNTIKSRLNYAKKFLKAKVEEHQKQYSYKLFSFSPAILLLALRELLASEKYTMAPESAEKLYHVACETLGITASTVAVGAAATTASSTAAGAAATTATATTAAETVATTAATAAKGTGLFGKFMALSTAKKTGAVLLATALLGGGATTAVLLTNDNPKPPAVVEEVEYEIPEVTASVITEAPSVTALPLPDGEEYVYSINEYYSYLGQQAKKGAEKAQVYLHPQATDDSGTLTDLENIPELQRYAGINVSLNTTLSKSKQEVEYTCTNGDVHTIHFRIADVTFTYDETEIAAYSEEDYWEKVKNALTKRLETFTIYMVNSAEQPAVQWSKYRLEEHPTDDLAEVLANVVCYKVDSKLYKMASSQTLSIQTYYCTHPDSNDVIIQDEREMLDTISGWYEGNRESGVTFFINGSGYNEFGASVSEKITYLRDWFASQYPSSEYVMEFGTFPESETYYTCTIKKPGDPEPTPEEFPPVDDTVSLAPIATPWPTPAPIPNIVLSDEEVTTTAGRIISEIITPNMSETEKAKAIHDYMILHMDPDAHTEFLHNIPEERTTVNGALGSGYASCAGYAATFQYLCDLAGLEATCITGHTSCWDHAWNQVKIDGNWYHIDVYADENVTTLTKEFEDHSGATYSYFLVSDDDLGYIVSQADPTPHPCTAESIAYNALEYGCPWDFLVFDPTEEEITLAAEKASAEGHTYMKLIFTDQRYGNATKKRDLQDAIYMGSYKNHYATEGLIVSETSKPAGGERVYYFYDIWFMAKDGVPVTYPYADTTEKVHEVISQAISQHKTQIDLYAPDLTFLQTAVRSYPTPENHTSAPYAGKTSYGGGIIRPDTLFYISFFPENKYDWPY